MVMKVWWSERKEEESDGQRVREMIFQAGDGRYYCVEDAGV